jgi:hypothetical protein
VQKLIINYEDGDVDGVAILIQSSSPSDIRSNHPDPIDQPYTFPSYSHGQSYAGYEASEALWGMCQHQASS